MLTGFASHHCSHISHPDDSPPCWWCGGVHAQDGACTWLLLVTVATVTACLQVCGARGCAWHLVRAAHATPPFFFMPHSPRHMDTHARMLDATKVGCLCKTFMWLFAAALLLCLVNI